MSNAYYIFVFSVFNTLIPSSATTHEPSKHTLLNLFLVLCESHPDHLVATLHDSFPPHYVPISVVTPQTHV